jgi:hypothetical protein
MPSKKKSKPSFKVPEDLESAQPAGWVYRSEVAPADKEGSAAAVEEPTGDSGAHQAAAASTVQEPPAGHAASSGDSYSAPASSKTESSRSATPGILDLTARTFSSGMATIGNALMLGAAILTAPFRMGLWIVGLRSRD